MTEVRSRKRKEEEGNGRGGRVEALMAETIRRR